MVSQQCDVSFFTAMDTYLLQWTQTLNEIKLQYLDAEQSEAACFQEEQELLLVKYRNELQHLQSNYNTVVEYRKQVYITRLMAHIKAVSEFNFRGQMSIPAGQQVEQAQQPLNIPIKIQNALISPRDDDILNAQLEDTSIAESQAPESAPRGSERSTQPKLKY
ncbi:hypothetical protein GGR55DRAFT_260619 [Xylaria sp. FL0064]|nr:hypothetical protein GGR55DRAFT_260619 [Xylaria sp. FL0064]